MPTGLAQIAQWSASAGFGYDRANRRTSLMLPNGIVAQHGYDSPPQFTSLSYLQGSTREWLSSTRRS
jgi:hypothetical protein